MYYRWPRGNWGNPAGRELIYSNPILGELNQSQQFSNGDGVANLTVPNTVPVNKAVIKGRLKIGLFWLCWYFLAQLISSLRWSWMVLSINTSKQQSSFYLFWMAVIHKYTNVRRSAIKGPAPHPTLQIWDESIMWNNPNENLQWETCDHEDTKMFVV